MISRWLGVEAVKKSSIPPNRVELHPAANPARTSTAAPRERLRPLRL